MRKLLNTLYVTTADSYLSLDGENIVILQGEDVLGRVPLHNIEAIVCFGYKGASPALMGMCAQKGIGLSFLTPHGRFLARVTGPVQGNVFLRDAQYAWASDPGRSVELARMFLRGKIFNARWCLERAKRDHPERIEAEPVGNAVTTLKNTLLLLDQADDVPSLMGMEGFAAKAYFDVLGRLILREENAFAFEGRSRRPPLDRTNALLSFGYTLLTGEIASALESVGLDPYVGFMHQKRPGRVSLALDLLEELRAPVVDRFVLTQINLGTITPADFARKENGAYFLKDDARKTFLTAWQKRKQEQITHPFLKEKIPWGLMPYAQAMLLARHLRGDLDAYPPFLWK